MLFFFSFSFATPVLAAEEGAPTISAAPIVISVGGTYDPLAGLVVTDDVDSEAELLSTLTYYDGNVEISTPGVYTIYYDIFDSEGHWASLRRPIFVLGPDMPLIFPDYLIAEYNSIFDPMAGVCAFDLVDGELTASIIVLENNVDTSMLGEYYVIYEVTDSDMNRVEQTIPVYIEYPIEYYPTITAPDLMLKVGDVYDPMEGVTATDMTDIDLTGQIEVRESYVDTSRPGVYFTDYWVINSLGLTAYETSIVFVFDMTTSPSFVAEEYWIETGSIFDPKAGIYAYDLEDGDLTDKIEVVENTVDMSHAGEYFLIYRVQDSDGNFAEYTRMIFVEWSWDLMPFIQVDPYMVFLPLDALFDPMAGVSVIDPTDGDITDNIIVNSDVDTSRAGEYIVNYTITNSLGISNGNQRIVFVFDSSVPIIRAYDFESPLGQEIDNYSVHFEAYDLEDGDLWESIVWDINAVDIYTVGTYPIMLSVTDSDGNTAQTTCNVTIKDYSYPQLEAYDHQVIIGTDYNPLNYVYAWDQEDGEISHLIQVLENNVDTNTLGTYTVTYSVTNSQDKTTTKTVNVEVINEPLVEYFLIYDGNMIRMEIDEQAEKTYITSPVLIPAGSVLSLALYVNGELIFEFPGFILLNEIQPGFLYSISSNEASELLATTSPYLYNGAAIRLNGKNGEIKFTSTVDGEVYYAIAEKDAGVPDIDTSGEGIQGKTGINTITVENLKPGITPQVVYVVIKTSGEEYSNVLTIDIPAIPTPINNGKKPDNPGKPIKEEIAPDVVEEVPTVEEPKNNSGQDKKDDPVEEPVIEEPKTNNGQDKKDEAPVIESAAEEPKADKGIGQEKKELEAIEEVSEEVPLILESETIEILDEEKDKEKDKDKKEDEPIELLEEKTNNGKSDKG